MRFLKAIRLRRRYFQEIENQINAIFDQLIYDPLRAVIKSHGRTLENALSVVAEALAVGKIFFVDGAFYGDFNSKIGRELRELGAVYDGRKKAWFIPEYNLPQSILREIRTSELRYRLFRSDVLQTIEQINTKKIKPIDYTPTISMIENDLIATIKAVAVPTILSERQKKRVADEWGTNLDLFIKGWANENIIKLRQQVEANTIAGGRAEGLHEVLKQNYGTSKNKARFLARQETSLLMSKLRQLEYESVGLPKYKWDGTMDEKERPDHLALQGLIFTWDKPPITNASEVAKGKPPRRNHPGEDWECRCIAVPVLELSEVHDAEAGVNLATVKPDFTPTNEGN